MALFALINNIWSLRSLANKFLVTYQRFSCRCCGCVRAGERDANGLCLFGGFAKMRNGGRQRRWEVGKNSGGVGLCYECHAYQVSYSEKTKSDKNASHQPPAPP
jgi:hypothetical protein